MIRLRFSRRAHSRRCLRWLGAVRVFLGLAVVGICLFGCKARQWHSQLPPTFDRPTPFWIDIPPNEPGTNWFAVGRVRFDTPAGRVRAPLQAEAQARQHLARDLRPVAQAAAEWLIDTLPVVRPPTIDTATAAAVAAELDAGHLRQLAREAAERVAQRIGRLAQVVDEWLDSNSREYFVLVRVPFRRIVMCVVQDVREHHPAALRMALMPAAAVRAQIMARQRQRRTIRLPGELETGGEPDGNWPRREPSTPGKRWYAGGQLLHAASMTDPEIAARFARLRLAEKISTSLEHVLASYFMDQPWPVIRLRGARVLAADIATAVACDAAEQAELELLALDPPRLDHTDSLTGGADRLFPELDDEPRESIAWYAPRALRPRPSRALVGISSGTVMNLVMRWIRLLVPTLSPTELEIIAVDISSALADDQASRYGVHMFAFNPPD